MASGLWSLILVPPHLAHMYPQSRARGPQKFLCFPRGHARPDALLGLQLQAQVLLFRPQTLVQTLEATHVPLRTKRLYVSRSTHVCIYRYRYIYIYISIYTYIYTYIYIHIYIYTRRYAYIHKIYVSIYIQIVTYMYTYVCMYMYRYRTYYVLCTMALWSMCYVYVENALLYALCICIRI